MNTFIDSRLISISSDTADIINNGTYLSSCTFKFPGLLTDDDDILYTQISIQSAQIPVSFYIVNVYNNILKYKLGTGTIQTITFDRGNYNAVSFATQFKTKIPALTLTFNKYSNKYTISGTQDFTLYFSGSSCFQLLGLDKSLNYISSSLILDCPYSCQFQGITRIKILSNAFSTYSMDSLNNGYSNTLACISVNTTASGIILYQNSSLYKPIFRDRSVDGFDISLLDNNGNLINFNNTAWHITLQLDITRKLVLLDKTFPHLSNIIKAPEDPNIITNQPQQNNITDLPKVDDDLDFLMYQHGIYQ